MKKKTKLQKKKRILKLINYIIFLFIVILVVEIGYGV